MANSPGLLADTYWYPPEVGLVTGIGFLGGGVLLRNNDSVKGLTTASAIWVSAAIGICFAANQVVMGFFCCIFTFLILRIKKDPMAYLDEINNSIDNVDKD